MWFPLRNQIMTEREPKEIIQALINEYKTYKKASFLIIPILAIAAAATFFNRVLSLVLLAAAVIYQIFYLRKKQKNYLASVTRENLLLTTAKKLHSDAPLPQSGGEPLGFPMPNIGYPGGKCGRLFL